MVGMMATQRYTPYPANPPTRVTGARRRGRLRMISRSGGLKPSAVAGRPSVTRFTHRSCTGFNTSGMPAAPQAHSQDWGLIQSYACLGFESALWHGSTLFSS